MMEALILFGEFFKTGLFAIGGGLAALPFLYDMAEQTGWFTGSDIINMIAISESTPGPLGINMATYVGYTTAGIPGAVIATLGLITPSIIVILVIAGCLKSFRNNRFVNSVFVCLRPASTGLIVASGLSVAAVTFFGVSDLASITMEAVRAFDWKALVLAVILLVLTRWIKPTKKLHPIVWILCSAVVGVAFSFAGV